MLRVRQVFERLQTETGKVEGAWVENNKFCITVHFRRVKEEVSREGPCPSIHGTIVSSNNHRTKCTHPRKHFLPVLTAEC